MKQTFEQMKKGRMEENQLEEGMKKEGNGLIERVWWRRWERRKREGVVDEGIWCSGGQSIRLFIHHPSHAESIEAVEGGWDEASVGSLLSFGDTPRIGRDIRMQQRRWSMLCFVRFL